ncbi:MAG: hypothetical protein AAFR18_11940 [Cyanobacteria bacterium J06627_32]
MTVAPCASHPDDSYVLSAILAVPHQNSASRFVLPYAASDVTVIDSRIVVTCSDAISARRAQLDAISFGISAHTSGNQLILYYDDTGMNNADTL